MQMDANQNLDSSVGEAIDGQLPAIGKQVDEQGYCVVRDALDDDQLERLRNALDRLVAEDEAEGIDLRYGPHLSNRRVRRLVHRSEEFAELALHPLALAVVKQILGYDEVQLSTLTANITGPGGDEGIGTLHADQDIIPGFFPKRLICNTAFFLDDYTEENGATVFVPGSDKLPDGTADGSSVDEANLECFSGPAGSFAAWHGFLHHATGRNKPTDQIRRGILVTWYAPFLRGQENWCRTLDPAILERHPGLADITGFTEWRTLGGVHGGKSMALNY